MTQTPQQWFDYELPKVPGHNLVDANFGGIKVSLDANQDFALIFRRTDLATDRDYEDSLLWILEAARACMDTSLETLYSEDLWVVHEGGLEYHLDRITWSESLANAWRKDPIQSVVELSVPVSA